MYVKLGVIFTSFFFTHKIRIYYYYLYLNNYIIYVPSEKVPKDQSYLEIIYIDHIFGVITCVVKASIEIISKILLIWS